MKWTLFFFLFFLIFAFIGVGYLQDPGSVQIVWLGFDIQLSVVVAIVILLMAILIFSLVKVFLSWIFGIPLKWLSFLKGDKLKQHQTDLLDLYITLEAENYALLLEKQEKAKPSLKQDPLFLWILGNAFANEDKVVEAEQCFVELTHHPAASFLGLKGQIREAIRRGDTRLTGDFLDRAERLAPTSPWVLNQQILFARSQKNFDKAESYRVRLEDLGYLQRQENDESFVF